jgi:hypothetical protein
MSASQQICRAVALQTAPTPSSLDAVPDAPLGDDTARA